VDVIQPDVSSEMVVDGAAEREASFRIRGARSGREYCRSMGTLLGCQVATLCQFLITDSCCIPDYLKWHNIIDTSSPVDFALTREQLEIATAGACFPKRSFIHTEDIKRFAVFSLKTNFVSEMHLHQVARARRGIHIEDRYTLEFDPPVALRSAGDAEALRAGMTDGALSSDDTLSRNWAAFRHQCGAGDGDPLPATRRASSGEGEVRAVPHHPCVCIGARVHGSVHQRAGGGSVVRLSRNRWLRKDLDEMLSLTARLNAAIGGEASPWDTHGDAEESLAPVVRPELHAQAWMPLEPLRGVPMARLGAVLPTAPSAGSAFDSQSHSLDRPESGLAAPAAMDRMDE